jgi:hypothetical protein
MSSDGGAPAPHHRLFYRSTVNTNCGASSENVYSAVTAVCRVASDFAVFSGHVDFDSYPSRLRLQFLFHASYASLGGSHFDYSDDHFRCYDRDSAIHRSGHRHDEHGRHLAGQQRHRWRCNAWNDLYHRRLHSSRRRADSRDRHHHGCLPG